MNNNVITVEGEFNGKKITLETGKLATQANSAVLAKVGGTSVLATVVAKASSEKLDFLNLRMDYEEKYYAGGLISGARFRRREGRPTDQAIVNGRLIDHAIRPLFANDYADETQIIVNVLSIDGENNPLVVGSLATSAALAASGLPFNGPFILVNIKRGEDNKPHANIVETNGESDMSLDVTYLENGEKVQSIEAEADIIAEDEVFEAIKACGKEVKPLFDLVEKLKKAVNPEPYQYEPSWLKEEVIEKFKPFFFNVLEPIAKKGMIFANDEWKVIEEKARSEAIELDINKNENGETIYDEKEISIIFDSVKKLFTRDMVINKNKRIDGRDFDEVRPLSGEVDLIPRVHGVSLFTRGQTQSLTFTTLSSMSQMLTVQDMYGEEEKRYFHHYNFPPFSTGEVGRVGGANRRAIGHGLLAEKALLPVLPSVDSFPYAIRTVSELLGSNGSTSMAATCGSSMSLMDAGVPIKEHVGAIGVGLFVDTKIENPKIDDYLILTDILGQEDFAGYMDFKMTGTKDGMTAIQMELKLHGIPIDLLKVIFDKSKAARLQVLEFMNNVIDKPRDSVKEFTPKVDGLYIDKDNIGTLIGPGGAMIKKLMKDFEVDINVEEMEEKGHVSVSGVDAEAIANAKKYITGMFEEPEVGKEYVGTVTRVEDYGAFVEILPTQLGLLHVSEYDSDQFIKDMNNVVKVGDVIKSKVKSLEGGKISLTQKSGSNNNRQRRSNGNNQRNRNQRFNRNRRNNNRR